MKPIVVSFFSDIENSTYYSDHAKRLVKELTDLGIEHDVRKKISLGSYQSNCLSKPQYILDRLEEFKRPVIWIDVDTIVHKPFNDFNICQEIDFGFACSVLSGPTHLVVQEHINTMPSSPLYFNNTEEAKDFLDKWICSSTVALEKENNLDNETLKDVLHQELLFIEMNIIVIPGENITDQFSDFKTKTQITKKIKEMTGMKETEIPELLIKMPSRSRPEKFKEIITEYIKRLSGKHNVKFVFTFDTDDETMNNPQMKFWLDAIEGDGISVNYYFGDNSGKIKAVNADLEKQKADILLLASDDMWPIVDGYDEVVINAMKTLWPDFDGAIHFNDGLRQDGLFTLPIMGWKLYEQFGYIYHPDYISIYADDEATQVLKKMNKLIILGQQCIIQHKWVPRGHHDALHDRNEAPELYEADRRTFEMRAAKGFPKETIFK